MVSKRTGPTYVIGTGLSHDGSTCLLVDGVVEVAIEKERLTRVKHDGYGDRSAMQYVLDAAGISLDDVAVVVQNENFGMFHDGNTYYSGEERLLTEDTRVVTISHHLAHAYSAFGASPFDDTSVLVVDGCGNSYEDCMDIAPGTSRCDVPKALEHLYFEKDSYYHSAGNGLTAVAKDFSEWGAKGSAVGPPTTLHSIGGLYNGFSKYVFGNMDDAGKLMGLAPYGRLGRYTEPLFDLEGGRIFVRRDSLQDFNTPARSPDHLKQNFDHFADIARWVQFEVERALLYLVRDRIANSPSRNLSYSGGVALNAVANRRILQETDVERLFVQPAAGDNGLALGCAYYGWMQVLGQERVRATGSVFLGVTYAKEQIKSALQNVSDRVEVSDLTNESSDMLSTVADLLASGKVVGWYQEGAEFGPRALGHRSILAHPGIDGLRDFVNLRIKFREDFRPFAPSVLAERAEEIFECTGHDYPYMLFVFNTRAEWLSRLGNVVHRDGSARLQTVSRERDPLYHDLLVMFEAATGCPVLLNTSMNKRGMPIVETPEEAVALFLEGGLDVLVLGDIVVTKAGQHSIDSRDRSSRSTLKADDVPLIGGRIRELSLVYDLSDMPISGIENSSVAPTLRFVDTAESIEIEPAAYRFLALCDGCRNYEDIAISLGISMANLIEIADPLRRAGLVAHLASGA